MQEEETPKKEEKRDYKEKRPAIDTDGKTFDELLKKLAKVDPKEVDEKEVKTNSPNNSSAS